MIVEYHKLLAAVRKLKSSTPEAEWELRQVYLRLAQVHVAFGNQQFSTDKYEQAKQAYQKALNFAAKLETKAAQRAMTQVHEGFAKLYVAQKRWGRLKQPEYQTPQGQKILAQAFAINFKQHALAKRFSHALEVYHKVIKYEVQNSAGQEALYEIRGTDFLELGNRAWKSGQWNAAEGLYELGLQVHPQHLALLTKDAELALEQENTTRFQQRYKTALPLLKADNPLSSILLFYAWLADPTQNTDSVLTSIERLEEAVEFDWWSGWWDFDTTEPILDRLNVTRRKQAEGFILYFEGKLDSAGLKGKWRGN